MGQITDAAEQHALSAANATLTDRLQDLFSDHVLELIALTLVGACIAIGWTQIIKRIWPPMPDAPVKDADERLRLYTLNGIGAGFGWTLIVVTAYMSKMLGAAMLIAGTVAVGLAIIAAAITPKTYDLLDAIWGWFWGRALPAIGNWILAWIQRKGTP